MPEELRIVYCAPGWRVCDPCDREEHAACEDAKLADYDCDDGHYFKCSGCDCDASECEDIRNPRE